MAFCPGAELTANDLGNIFQPPTDYSKILNDAIYGASNRTGGTYGPLTPDFINTRVAQIVGTRNNANSLVAPNFTDPNNADQNAAFEAYKTRLQSYINNSKVEYCFYYKMYKYYITELIRLVKSTTSGTQQTQNAINIALDNSRRYNTMLIDFTMIINGITNAIYNQSQTLASEVNNLNTQITDNYNKLKLQADVLQREAPAAELKRRMVDYTKEKSKSTNNLLSLYFFLDLVALGMLFYVYKASSA